VDLMPKSLTILHIIVTLSVGACFYYARQEAEKKTVQLGRLFRLPGFALVAALILMYIQARAKQPLWPFGAALCAGLAIGGARGITMALEIRSSRVLLPPGMRASIWIVIAMITAVAADIIAALVGPAGQPWRLYAAVLLMLCMGLLFGRAMILGARFWYITR
jgi:hypothetical protein